LRAAFCDIIRRRLKQIDMGDCAVTFTRDEIARLHQIFRHGACDWSRPGVEQRDLADAWTTFTGLARTGRATAKDDD